MAIYCEFPCYLLILNAETKITEASCKNPHISTKTICYPPYDTDTYLNEDYNVSWSELNNQNTTDTTNNPWLYQTSSESKSHPIWGRMDIYGGGGYVMNLGDDQKTARGSLKYLTENLWLDRSTRAAILEVSLFNPGANLFAAVNLMLEIPATGGVLPHADIHVMRLYYYAGDRALFRLFLDAIFIAFLLYFMVVEVKKMKNSGKSHCKDLWNILEITNVVLGVSCGVVHVVHYCVTEKSLKEFQERADGEFASFHDVIYWDYVLACLLGLVLFLAMIKLLKMLQINRKVAEFTSTLSLAKTTLIAFAVKVGIFFCAFSQLFYIIYGRNLLNYSSVIKSSETLFSMMLKSFKYDELVQQERFLGPVFFLLYVVVVGFIVMQILVAVLNGDYIRVKKGDILNCKDYELIDFLMNQFQKITGLGSSSESCDTKK